jgi:hypothetical protein
MTKQLLAHAVVIFAVIACLCSPAVAQVTQTVQAVKSYNADAAALSSLRWLKEQQNRDGSWGSNPTVRHLQVSQFSPSYLKAGTMVGGYPV